MVNYQLNVHRTKKLILEWCGSHYHIDDEYFKNDYPIKMDIQLSRKGLEFLLI